MGVAEIGRLELKKAKKLTSVKETAPLDALCASELEYDERQVAYCSPVGYVVERVLRERLSCLSDVFVDSLVVEVMAAIEGSPARLR